MLDVVGEVIEVVETLVADERAPPATEVVDKAKGEYCCCWGVAERW